MNSYLLIRKVLLTIIGGALTLLGLIFIVLPGPSVLFLLPGLYLLSLEYEQAKVWLKKVQKMMTKTSRWVDKKLRQRKHSY
jgi:uncharacterized membrane protein YbaN (DUF454 family)